MASVTLFTILYRVLWEQSIDEYVDMLKHLTYTDLLQFKSTSVSHPTVWDNRANRSAMLNMRIHKVGLERKSC